MTAANLTANVVSAANDFANLMPSKITFRYGGYITCIMGIAFMPWKLFADSHSFIFTWLLGYSAVLGGVCGVMLADYHIIRKRHLALLELYNFDSSGHYYYNHGVNWVGIICMILGVIPTIPGFLAELGKFAPTSAVERFFVHLYDYAWFVSLAISLSCYLLMMPFIYPNTLKKQFSQDSDGSPAA